MISTNLDELIKHVIRIHELSILTSKDNWDDVDSNAPKIGKEYWENAEFLVKQFYLSGCEDLHQLHIDTCTDGTIHLFMYLYNDKKVLIEISTNNQFCVTEYDSKNKKEMIKPFDDFDDMSDFINDEYNYFA